MNCRRIEELIPLYVERDLDESQLQAVSLHLDSCERCGRLIKEYRDSQQWMRSYSTVEFDDAFFDDVRRSVLRNIEVKPRLTWLNMIFDRLRFNQLLVVTAALLILIGGIALYSYLSKEDARLMDKQQIAREQKDKEEKDEAQKHPEEDELKDHNNHKEKPKYLPRHRHRKAVVAQKQKADKPLSQPVGDPGTISEPLEGVRAESDFGTAFGKDDVKMPEGMTRIEIQTKDPSIRIIWFAPKPDDSRSSKPMTD